MSDLSDEDALEIAALARIQQQNSGAVEKAPKVFAFNAVLSTAVPSSLISLGYLDAPSDRNAP